MAFDPIHEARQQWEAHRLDEPIAMAAATSVMRAQQLVSTAVERALRPHGLSFARYEVLMLLSFTRKGSLPMTKMGDRLMVHPTGISKLVDKLEDDGLVQRVPDPGDRRRTLATITPAGRRLAAKATKAVTAVRFGVDLGDEELERLIDGLTHLRHVAGDFD
ncbi:MAG TPA: MarR family transcriptional regulator [Acidimicrobiales bacterium]|nr:MarR family transcriptional regulator [Acidimicrobiales bacterium]